jgi:hypothetical protein
MQLDTLTLPTDLIWIDEFDWTPVQQTQTYSITGALIIERGIKQAGREITLAGDNSSGMISRADLKTLETKLTLNTPLVLTLNDARTFNVIFNHAKKPIDAKPQIDFSTPDDGDLYTLKINLLAV